MGKIGEPIVTLTFKQGDAIPDWLLSIEPSAGGKPSKLGTFEFNCDGWVLEVGDTYFLVASGKLHPFIHIDNAKNVSIFAATKTVRAPLSEHVICGRESSDAGKGRELHWKDSKSPPEWR